MRAYRGVGRELGMTWTQVYHGTTPKQMYDLSWDLWEVIEWEQKPPADDPSELNDMII